MKKEFIEFLIKSKILSFGEFETKSGRISPYFLNFGACDNGQKITRLAEAYANFIQENFSSSLVLFGPAYKGIPLVSTTAQALQIRYQRNVPFCFNRKEIKSHGEKGFLVGHKLRGKEKILIVEDVMTAGTTVRESIEILKDYNVEFIGVLISVDRQEKGQNDMSAIEEFKQNYNLPVYSIVQLDDIIEYAIKNSVIDEKINKKISQYRTRYGIERN